MNQANQTTFTPDQLEAIEVLKAYMRKMTPQQLANFLDEVLTTEDKAQKILGTI